MHGLRCSPAIPGFTRLLDEWVIGLTHYSAPDASAGVFDDPERFADTFADAISRVRAFAYPAGEAPTTTWVDGGASFELQGYPYVVAKASVSVSHPDELATVATEAMNEAAARAAEALQTEPSADPEAANDASADDDYERVAVGLVFVRVERGSGEAAADAREFRDATRALPTTGSAWSFPSEADGQGYRYVGESSLGGIVLALRSET